MNRRIALVIGLLMTAIAAAYLFRPVTIQGRASATIRGPYLRVHQALAAANVHPQAGDRVSPDLDAWIPLDGRITIQPAAQVWIWENGWLKQASSPLATAASALQQAGVTLQPQDRLLWNGAVIDGSTSLPLDRPVVLQIERAKSIRLHDGTSDDELLARGPTAAHALWQAGLRPAPGDRISNSTGAALETGLALGYVPARTLRLQVNGGEIAFSSSAATVGEAIARAGIAPQAYDQVQPAEDQPVPDDGLIRLVRVREDVLLTETLTPYESMFTEDPNTELDARSVLQAGQYGVQVTRERVRYEDGQEVHRAVDSDWTASQAVAETIGYGTKVVVQTADMPDGSIEYWRKVHVYATSYSPCRLGTGDGRCGYITASGARLTKGIVAVPRAWFSAMRGQQVYIPGYGFGVIADTGGMRGLHIDLGFDEENFEEGAIVGWVDLYFLTPVPASIPWTLQ